MATDSSERIWQVLAQVPAGKVASYGQIAELADLPRAARLVGNVLSKLPEGSKLPWHRIINSQGRISSPEGSPRYLKQKQRLEDEGVVLIKGRIKMAEFRWRP